MSPCGSRSKSQLYGIWIFQLSLPAWVISTYQLQSAVFACRGFPTPFRIPSFYRKDPKAHRFTRTFRSFDGDDGIRTHDPLLAGQVLSQLSYTPICVPFGFPFSSFFSLVNDPLLLRLTQN